jgi:hypothetical protein
MSTMTQWINSTRGNPVAMVLPSLLKFSREEGTDVSTQIKTKDFASSAISDQDSWGFLLSPNAV